jgi:hypothetical protein
MVEPRAGEVGRRALDVEAPVRRVHASNPLLSILFLLCCCMCQQKV